jgi:O-acetyl-ADP-ribose deacetylase (regulator of RNase III)
MRTYQVGCSTITLNFGNIITSSAEVLVSSDDYMLTMGGGVSRAIKKAGGDRVGLDASKMVPAQAGDVIVSTAGHLGAKYILHAVTRGSQEVDLPPDAIVRQTTRRVMDLLPALGCTSVAFPTIGGGDARIPYETVASEMATVLVGLLLETEAAYEVELYLSDSFPETSREKFFDLFEVLISERSGILPSVDELSVDMGPPFDSVSAMASDQVTDSEQVTESERRHQIQTMLRHLDTRRDEIEASLLKVLTGKETSEGNALSQLREQLDEIQALRQNYEAELVGTRNDREDVIDNAVFVSSTSIDLKPHRKAVWDVINDLNLTFIGMEEFAPTELAPVDLIRQKVIESNVYLGILGMRYGFVDPGTGLSMTELEYRQAIASDKRICMFVMADNAPILANMVEDDPVRFAKLIDFRGRILKAHTCAMFTDPSDLANKAQSTLKDI